jgi:hypothetical protein
MRIERQDMPDILVGPQNHHATFRAIDPAHVEDVLPASAVGVSLQALDPSQTSDSSVNMAECVDS